MSNQKNQISDHHLDFTRNHSLSLAPLVAVHIQYAIVTDTRVENSQDYKTKFHPLSNLVRNSGEVGDHFPQIIGILQRYSKTKKKTTNLCTTSLLRLNKFTHHARIYALNNEAITLGMADIITVPTVLSQLISKERGQ